jgi:dTDP-4-dehydrorhamnose 3,5-epimerase
MALEVLPTRLDGPLLLAPQVFGDERGFFLETFREEALAELGITDRFVQDNHSRSVRGVVRGLHFQQDTGKLVRCARGTILDVLVDIRDGSDTFGQWEAFELSDRTGRVLWAPPGFAHGFAVLSDVADVLYKQTRYWQADADRAIQLADPALGIDWPIPPDERVLSDRDRSAAPLADVLQRR